MSAESYGVRRVRASPQAVSEDDFLKSGRTRGHASSISCFCAFASFDVAKQIVSYLDQERERGWAAVHRVDRG